MAHIASSAKISQRHRQRLQEKFPEVRFSFYEGIHEVLEQAADADGLITYGEDLTGERLRRLPRLRWIHVISAGVEQLPFSELEQAGILVTNSRGIHEVPMGEYTVAVMLDWVRKLSVFRDRQRERRWDPSIRVGELAGKTAAILGAGAIGQGIAKRLQAFDMKVWGVNTTGKPLPQFDQVGTLADLKPILEEADFVVVTLPHTPQTEGLLGEEAFGWMKPTSFLINIARGPVVVERALLRALNQRQIGGAVLDVFDQEPLQEDHPFWEMDNLLITPHISGRSPLYMTRALEIFERNLPVYLSGNGAYINRLDLSRGY
ncbi:Phosphoglycerate dehydrogenase [Melghirimyces thermohalophilus]|uniref:Phosphoglycerate dehydrogenase n=1 Tax=Melghirimyces thermohalophilus TaxID=1236220 RepID=A0A1G6RSM4_9BACL|nr:D-2-hydroxyacid dehydrogenase [Melghirimyces thermohalophilus]SDD06965.1 Phosphoglycerate dehydrogenase [Melghirimyces thermohalophilus]